MSTLKEGEAPRTTAVPLELFGSFWDFLENFLFWTMGFFHIGLGGAPAPQELHLTYVMCMYQVILINNEPQYCIRYASGQQPGRARGPDKSLGPPNGSPKGNQRGPNMYTPCRPKGAGRVCARRHQRGPNRYARRSRQGCRTRTRGGAPKGAG